uniref:Uncharacterized protein n=1 Tax=Oryza glumipatula TaxID=40148 RepID=A0A0D9Z127_9ORYZ
MHNLPQFTRKRKYGECGAAATGKSRDDGAESTRGADATQSSPSPIGRSHGDSGGPKQEGTWGKRVPALAELLVFGLQNGVEEERVTNTAVGAARLEDGIPTSTLQSALANELYTRAMA